jgi:hypothetical protein
MYKVYYKLEDGNFKTYDGKNISTQKSSLSEPHFELSKGCDKTDKNLIEYHKDVKIWAEQIKNTFTTNTKPDYLGAYTDILASVRFFNFMCSKYYKEHDTIDDIESKYIDKPYNGGLMYVKDMTETEKVYTNDKNMYYTEIMGNENYDFFIPDKKGYETHITKLKLKKLKYGFYHIKIEAKTDDAYKIFSFNIDSWYNYYCVKFVLENEEYFDYELITDVEYNAYLYDSVVKCSDICNGWFKKLTYLKSSFPKNKLVKNLTRAWGGLSMKNTIKVNEEEIIKNPDKYESYEIIDTLTYGTDGEDDYLVVHKLKNINDQVYKHNIRLKSWLNSYCRCNLAKTILKNIDKVVRVQTDSITYNKNVKPDETEKREEKTTGYIIFKSVNSYFHECVVCKKQFKYKDLNLHQAYCDD